MIVTLRHCLCKYDVCSAVVRSSAPTAGRPRHHAQLRHHLHGALQDGGAQSRTADGEHPRRRFAILVEGGQ